MGPRQSRQELFPRVGGPLEMADCPAVTLHLVILAAVSNLLRIRIVCDAADPPGLSFSEAYKI